MQLELGSQSMVPFAAAECKISHGQLHTHAQTAADGWRSLAEIRTTAIRRERPLESSSHRLL